jgi:hypothetical protein
MRGWLSEEASARFALEPLPAVGIGGKRPRQDFDGDGPVAARVPRPVDLAL